jgi:tRNA pseudouridine55 synthase
MSGMLVVNKPTGMISKDLSRWLQRRFGKLKIGHVGTLDPGASGVLPILLGKATRMQDYLLDLTKSYEFDVDFGSETDTLDYEGEVIKRCEFEHIELADLKNAVESMRGQITQIPPIYSAVKYQGKPLYDYARSGKGDTVPLESLARKVEVFKIDLLKYEGNRATISVSCSKGTYVRVLAKDIAEIVKSCGTLTRLVRTRAAGVDLSQSCSLDDIESNMNEMEKLLTPLECIEMEIPKWVSPDDGAVSKLRSGQEVVVDASSYLSGLEGEKELPEAFAMPMVLLDCEGRAFGMGTARILDMARVKINLKRGL